MSANIGSVIRQALPNTFDYYLEPKDNAEFRKEQKGLLDAIARVNPEAMQELQDRNTANKLNILDFMQFYSDDREMLPYRREAVKNQVYRGIDVPWGTEDDVNLFYGSGRTGVRGIMSPLTGQAFLPGRAHESAIVHESTHGEDLARGYLFPNWKGKQHASLEDIENSFRLHDDIYKADLEYLKNNESIADNPMLWELLLESTAAKARDGKGSTNRFKGP